jgi:hypothetical protein
MVARAAGMPKAPRPVQGAVLARAEQAAALAAQELVDQGEAVHRLILPCRSYRYAQSSLQMRKFVGNKMKLAGLCELLFRIRHSLTVFRAKTVKNSVEGTQLRRAGL